MYSTFRLSSVTCLMSSTGERAVGADPGPVSRARETGCAPGPRALKKCPVVAPSARRCRRTVHVLPVTSSICRRFFSSARGRGEPGSAETGRSRRLESGALAMCSPPTALRRAEISEFPSGRQSAPFARGHRKHRANAPRKRGVDRNADEGDVSKTKYADHEQRSASIASRAHPAKQVSYVGRHGAISISRYDVLCSAGSGTVGNDGRGHAIKRSTSPASAVLNGQSTSSAASAAAQQFLCASATLRNSRRGAVTVPRARTRIAFAPARRPGSSAAESSRTKQVTQGPDRRIPRCGIPAQQRRGPVLRQRDGGFRQCRCRPASLAGSQNSWVATVSGISRSITPEIAEHPRAEIAVAGTVIQAFVVTPGIFGRVSPEAGTSVPSATFGTPGVRAPYLLHQPSSATTSARMTAERVHRLAELLALTGCDPVVGCVWLEAAVLQAGSRYRRTSGFVEIHGPPSLAPVRKRGTASTRSTYRVDDLRVVSGRLRMPRKFGERVDAHRYWRGKLGPEHSARGVLAGRRDWAARSDS